MLANFNLNSIVCSYIKRKVNTMAIIKDEDSKFTFELTDEHFIAHLVKRNECSIEDATVQNKEKGSNEFWVRMSDQDVDELNAFTLKLFNKLN